ncbi:MAG: hypothetical protein ACKVT0_00665 [Planctomycetaceae bacterium]
MMQTYRKNSSALILALGLGGCLWCSDLDAQAKNPAQAAAGANANVNAGVEILTRGPVHEAFAEQLNLNPVAGVSIERQPPAAIDEIPPRVKPKGANVQWIPGYWGWDVAENDFLWVSGIWRNAPPANRWIPGYWKPGDKGAQWNSGFWMKSDVKQLTYNTAPPQSLERGPSSDGDPKSQFYVPGNWEPKGERYQWRPGYWAPYQSKWLWVPSKNTSTASGFIHVPGYWDYSLSQRGTIFAPARIQSTAAANGTIQFTPNQIIDTRQLPLHMFAQNRTSGYLFGNYYDQQFAGMGIKPWFATQTVPGVIDPTLGFSSWTSARTGVNYVDRLTSWNNFFLKNTNLRPALTLTNQLQLASSLKGTEGLKNALISAPLTSLVTASPTQFVNLNAAQHAAIVGSVNNLKLVGDERLAVESAVGDLSSLVTKGDAIQLPVAPLSLPAADLPVIGGDAGVNGAIDAVVPVDPSQLLGGDDGEGGLPLLNGGNDEGSEEGDGEGLLDND